MTRYSKGTYLLEVLLHKYKNGNGRVARGMKMLFDKVDSGADLTDDEIKQVLGIGKQGVTQTGETTYKINFNPDFERLVLGVCYFALEKGIPQEEVIGQLKLNGMLPEQGLEKLAERLKTPLNKMREDYIKYMVVDSDLSWCNFE